MTRRSATFLALCSPFAALAHDHGILHNLFKSPNKGAFGYDPLPLDSSYDNVPLQVHGSVPDYLKGTLYRGAPGAWPDGWWLDGLITLNAFKFSEGKVFYSMKWNKDNAYNRTFNKEDFPELPEKPLVPGALRQPMNSSWPTGVAFSQVAGHLTCSSGVSHINNIDHKTLEPVQMPFVYGDEWDAPYLSPTHDIVVDGYTLHHLITGVIENSGGTTGYTVTSIKPGERKREVIAQIDKPGESSPFAHKPSFMHMPLATSEYYIMLENPCYYPSTPTQIGHVDWKGFSGNPLVKTHVRLVNRKTGESTIYPLSSGIFAIHHINAYYNETSNSIVMDTVKLFPSFLPCGLAFSMLTMDHYVNHSTANGKASTPLRLILPLDKPGATVEPKEIQPDAIGMEFPTIRYDELNGKPYEYAYAAWVRTKESDNFDALLKLNVQTGQYLSWYLPGHYPGEPIFVPNPHGSDEDDGVVMTNVLDVDKQETYLLLLDAKTMKEIAHVGPTPQHIPHGYHGRYFDDSVFNTDSQTLVV